MTGESVGGILVDTSAWIDALRFDGDLTVRANVRTVLAQGSAHFCDMVLLELWNGARGESEVAFLGKLERDIECVPTTPEVWSAAREMARACRNSGVTVPPTDLLIAACAESHGLSLLHHDTHFDLIAQAVEEQR